jgi:hypothetical protein
MGSNMSRYKVTIVLGDLAEPLEKAAAKSGKKISQEIRDRLAASLKVKSPDMPVGFASMDPMLRAEISYRGNKARQATLAKRREAEKLGVSTKKRRS